MTHKIIWREGMFIRPQHFQQQERYFESLLMKQPTALGAYRYGFEALTINHELLEQGTVVVEAARGFFEDGSAFSFPDQSCCIAPLRIPESVVTTRVYLGLALSKLGVAEVGSENTVLCRYHAMQQAMQDSVSYEQTADIEVAILQLHLLLEEHDRSHYTCLPLLDIKERRIDHQLNLNTHFIPPVLDVTAAPKMLHFIEEIQGLLQYRADALAQRFVQSRQSEASVALDFMLLQLLNRYELIFNQLSVRAKVHPETVFQHLTQCIAELSTYLHDSHRPRYSCVYRHDDLCSTFLPLMQEIRDLLRATLEQPAILIELLPQDFGVYIGQCEDPAVLKKSIVLLGVTAEISGSLEDLFPKQVKIASIAAIRDLVSRGVSGIPLIPVSMVPRHIPYHEKSVYFRLDQQHPEWSVLQVSGTIALHVGGHFPELKLALWVVREV